MKAYRKRSFTLVELLVSIGLLSLMMMFMLRFFIGSQMLWKTVSTDSELRQSSHAALDLMYDLVTTVQFTLGEKTVDNAPKRDRTMDSIFSLDNTGTNAYGDANRMYFACQTTSALPKESNDIRFISFQLGAVGSEYARGKLFLLVYADKRNEKKFYSLFPYYDKRDDDNRTRGNRNGALDSLKDWLTLPDSETAENEYAQVIAENVVGFKIAAFDKSGNSATGEDISEPPCRLKIELTLLGKDDFITFVTLPAAAREDFLNQKASTFTRDIFIGDRWALDKVRLPDD